MAEHYDSGCALTGCPICSAEKLRRERVQGSHALSKEGLRYLDLAYKEFNQASQVAQGTDFGGYRHVMEEMSKLYTYIRMKGL